MCSLMPFFCLPKRVTFSNANSKRKRKKIESSELVININGAEEQTRSHCHVAYIYVRNTKMVPEREPIDPKRDGEKWENVKAGKLPSKHITTSTVGLAETTGKRANIIKHHKNNDDGLENVQEHTSDSCDSSRNNEKKIETRSFKRTLN